MYGDTCGWLQLGMNPVAFKKDALLEQVCTLQGESIKKEKGG